MSFGERFLAHPDLFPARMAGESFGGDELVVDLAGGPYAFSGLSAGQAGFLRERYRGFARPEGSAGDPIAVRCRVFRLLPGEWLELDLRGFELTLDRDCSEGAVRLAGVDLMARLEWRDSGSLGAGLWTSNEDPAYFHGALENLFRVLVAYRVMELDGVLLHSTGIVPAPADEPAAAAVVCYGASGAGKSTLSRLALGAGQRLLSDDLNAVLLRQDDSTGSTLPWLSPVPFAGDHRPPAWDPATRRLGALARLCKGEREALEPEGRSAALAGLLACAPYVNSDPHRLERVIGNLERLLDCTPTHRLTFALAGQAPSLLAQAVR